MAEGALWNLLNTILGSVAKVAFAEAASMLVTQEEIKNLKSTMKVIQARVGDAERCREDESSDTNKLLFQRLRTVLDQADALLDKVVTLESPKRPMLRKLPLPYLDRDLGNRIKSIKKELDAIKSDMVGLNLNVPAAINLPHLINPLQKKRETTSLVNTDVLIGRESDENAIIHMLLDPKYDKKKFTVIPIVGFGGIGKTSLAQLVFNDKRVKKHFDLCHWVYVPEKDDKCAIMGKIFNALTNQNYQNMSLEKIQQGIKESLKGTKYLLVLDDLWYEGRSDLFSPLKHGKKGSKVIVTTRSNMVAKVVGTIEVPHKLGTLTNRQSRKLFKKLALKPQHNTKSSLNEIGEEIVNMCGNVPLVIEAVCKLLNSTDGHEVGWMQVRDALRSKEQLKVLLDNEMPELKLSYDCLPAEVKKCFAYCSLFPKGYKFEKADLVHQWMAQGYIEPSEEAIGDQNLSKLFEGNFFQDHNFSGEDVKRCKMQHLVHELAQHVAGYEFMRFDVENPRQISDELVHVNFNGSACPPSLNVAKNLRSLLFVSCDANKLVSKFEYLRVLRLKDSQWNNLPNNFGRLKLLRYLNLGSNKIKDLPNSITTLKNLQTLRLEGCENLKELPRDFAKLVNLKHLFIPNELTDLPSEFGKLTSLTDLNMFVVGKNNGIDSLPANLRGELKIKFVRWRGDTILEVERANLKDNHRLISLELELNFNKEGEEAAPSVDEMLEKLQLPPNLEKLVVRKFGGDKMPSRWLDTSTKLVYIEIVDCKKCKVLPRLSHLPCLKDVRLESLDSLEYVEKECNMKVSTAADNMYFQCLEVLRLCKCSKLKGWARPSENDGKQQQQQQLLLLHLLSNLRKVEIIDCHKVETLKFSNSIQQLKISGCRKLRCLKGMRQLSKLETLHIIQCEELQISESKSNRSWEHLSSLRELNLRNIPKLEKLPRGVVCITTLQKLRLKNLDNLKKLPEEIGKLYLLCQLEIKECPKLKSLPESIPNLASLEELSIIKCPVLEKRCTKDGKDRHLIQKIKHVKIR